MEGFDPRTSFGYEASKRYDAVDARGDAEHIGVDHVVLDVCRYDPVTQILDENHVRIGAEGLIFSPIRLRLAHPPEFDLMARIAGLRLRERWGGWNREPCTATSWRHVSVCTDAIARLVRA